MVSEIVAVANILLFSAAGACLVYLTGLSVLAAAAPRTTVRNAANHRRFAVVVPAHNEELSLARTVRSLFEIQYSRALFDVIVVADNCSDRTAEIGRSQGAIVYERSHETLRSKGHALRWCFDRLLEDKPGYDAVVVIDADTVVSKNFLTVMNNRLEQGSNAIQCNDLVEPRPDAWSSEITRLGFTLYNSVRPLGRRILGASAGVRGNGMCFTTDVLRRVPWSTYSLTEDLEYGIILLLNGIKVDFAPEAIALAAMPANVRNAETQRTRWERGRWPIMRMYSSRLLIGAIRHGSFAMLDAFMDLIIPPFVNLLGAVTLLLIFNGLLLQLGISGSALFLELWFSLLILGAMHVFIGLIAVRSDRGLYKALLYIPKYAIWKILLYARIVHRSGKEREWIRTAREHVAAPEASERSKKMTDTVHHA